MKEVIYKIKKFLKGWESSSVHERPKTFWAYFNYFPINWIWTLGSILFIGLFMKGAIKYDSPLLWTATFFPFIMLIYNFAETYYAFKWYIIGKRKVSARLLINIVKISTSAILLYMIIRTFITG